MRRSTQSGRRVFGLTHRKSRKNVPSISTPLRGCKWRSGCKLLKLHGSVSPPWTPCPLYAIDAEIPKLDVAGSNPVSRSKINNLRVTGKRTLHSPPLSITRISFGLEQHPLEPIPQVASLQRPCPRCSIGCIHREPLLFRARAGLRTPWDPLWQIGRAHV